MKNYKNNAVPVVDRLNGSHLQGQVFQKAAAPAKEKEAIFEEEEFELEDEHEKDNPQKRQIRILKARLKQLRKARRQASEKGVKESLTYAIEDVKRQLAHARKHPATENDTLPFGSENKGKTSSYDPNSKSTVTHRETQLSETNPPKKIVFGGDAPTNTDGGGSGEYEKIHEFPKEYHGTKIKFMLEANAYTVRDSFNLYGIDAAGQATPLVNFPMMQYGRKTDWIKLPPEMVALKIVIKSEHPSNTMWNYKIHLKLPKINKVISPNGTRHLRENPQKDDD